MVFSGLYKRPVLPSKRLLQFIARHVITFGHSDLIGMSLIRMAQNTGKQNKSRVYGLRILQVWILLEPWFAEGGTGVLSPLNFFNLIFFY